MTPKLILTGFMATGKSAVARVLVRRLSWRLLDCDAEIVKRAGKPIAEIFRVLGEDYFRALERAVIVDIANDNRRCPLSGRLLPAIVATGGGAIVDLDNFAALNRAGIIVCLTARPEVIARRVGPSAKSRPMLTQGGSPIRKRIAELIAGRSEAYARAPVCVDTSDLNIDQAASAVLDAFTAYGQEKWAPSA
jgi:shikimate kinase